MTYINLPYFYAQASAAAQYVFSGKSCSTSADLTLTVCITAVNTDPTELDSSLLLLFV